MTRKKQGKRTRSNQKKSKQQSRVAIPILVALFIGIVGIWFLFRQDEAGATEIRLAPVSQLSDRVLAAPPVVQEAYRFAIANPDILSQIPCYCGCGNMGHESDLDCFVEEFNPDATVAVFGYHAYE
jgi:hypothetical protein